MANLLVKIPLPPHIPSNKTQNPSHEYPSHKMPENLTTQIDSQFAAIRNRLSSNHCAIRNVANARAAFASRHMRNIPNTRARTHTHHTHERHTCTCEAAVTRTLLHENAHSLNTALRATIPNAKCEIMLCQRNLSVSLSDSTNTHTHTHTLT